MKAPPPPVLWISPLSTHASQVQVHTQVGPCVACERLRLVSLLLLLLLLLLGNLGTRRKRYHVRHHRELSGRSAPPGCMEKARGRSRRSAALSRQRRRSVVQTPESAVCSPDTRVGSLQSRSRVGGTLEHATLAEAHQKRSHEENQEPGVQT